MVDLVGFQIATWRLQRPFSNIMTASFRKYERIRTRTDFQRIYRQGKKVASSSFVCYIIQDPTRPYCRLGITAKKQLGHAVIRNRCKRLVRELFRRNKEVLPPGSDVIVVIMPGMLGKRYADLEQEWSCLRHCM